MEVTATESTATESVSVAPEVSTTPDTTAASTEAEPTPSGLETLKANTGKKGAPDPVVEKPLYNPNYKFKVMDSEYEIDEFLRPVIKSQDIEKKIKDLYEKAYGLDAIKPKHQAVKEELESIKAKSLQTDQALETLGQFVRDNDFDSFFDGLNIPKNKILEYALELVRREQMSPEQKAQWEASKQAREAARYYEVQNQQLQQSQQQFAVQQRTFELDMALGMPEVKAISEAYNAGMGSPEAFKNYCIQIGQAYAARGQDIPAQHAVSEAVRQLRAINPGLGVAGTTNTAQVVQPSSKPVIPNIQGRGTSAVKPAVKSLDDLKKRAKEIINQDLNY
jgi:hypothetical protein